ncbi:hypothetical protein Q0V21_19295 [Paenibacillus sp. 11B]|uniref:hypothetical protein n=1 Tax=unclassified Paenibacillus TaxID=185978 RepID=UPI002655B269|nr:hypothetical protein [Paenibacillus sp. 11B]MDN8590907.1 hypothetical protein [Paenibacillus sp. 11B]
MNIQWLEPVIKTRSEEIADSILSSDGSSHDILLELIAKRDQMSVDEFNFELENLLIVHTKAIVERSYRVGVQEALTFRNMMV